jgi:hypothetical protein
LARLLHRLSRLMPQRATALIVNRKNHCSALGRLANRIHRRLDQNPRSGDDISRGTNLLPKSTRLARHFSTVSHV